MRQKWASFGGGELGYWVGAGKSSSRMMLSAILDLILLLPPDYPDLACSWTTPSLRERYSGISSRAILPSANRNLS